MSRKSQVSVVETTLSNMRNFPIDNYSETHCLDGDQRVMHDFLVVNPTEWVKQKEVNEQVHVQTCIHVVEWTGEGCATDRQSYH